MRRWLCLLAVGWTSILARLTMRADGRLAPAVIAVRNGCAGLASLAGWRGDPPAANGAAAIVQQERTVCDKRHQDARRSSHETHIETSWKSARAAGSGRVGDSLDNHVSELEGRIAACVITVPIAG